MASVETNSLPHKFGTMKARKIGVTMRMDWKKSMASAMLLIILGVVALYGGAQTLGLVIPLALLVWYGTGAVLGGGRN